MADVATLARHLLMAEVLQICESVHKKVEEQKLMVYQQGDIHTVVSSQPAPQQAPNEDPGAYIMTIGSDGHAVVTHTGLEEETSAHQTVDPAPQAEPQPPAAPQPPKRKRGRPAKVKHEVIEEPESPVEEEVVEVPEPVSTLAEEVQRTHDPYKRRLRQRSMGEGGYVRLHMGLEEDREDKKGAQTPQRPKPSQGPAQPDGGSEVEGEHACSECGLSFHRRYALIMHTLKHEKTRGYKCTVRMYDVNFIFTNSYFLIKGLYLNFFLLYIFDIYINLFFIKKYELYISARCWGAAIINIHVFAARGAVMRCNITGNSNEM
uniref:C2H2-type domain-containing protein n=1 Tax=Oncorhynchus mykiss TaxID=8022 RepID=A0A8C7M044_ONCMY